MLIPPAFAIRFATSSRFLTEKRWTGPCAHPWTVRSCVAVPYGQNPPVNAMRRLKHVQGALRRVSTVLVRREQPRSCGIGQAAKRVLPC